MKVCLWTIILPRLEVSFLEEWIVHHLELGFDKIYIYDNESSSNVNIGADNKYIPYYNIRKLEKHEIGVVFDKKPYSNYLLEFTDEQIYRRLHSIINKYKENVELINWRYGKEVKFKYPFSQAMGYNHCVSNNVSDWWMTIDPDEYIVLHKHKNIKDFINNNPNKHRFLIQQKIFQERVVGKPVRKIFNWAYREEELTKTLVEKPYFLTEEKYYEKNLSIDAGSIYNDVHETYSEMGMFSDFRNLNRLRKKGYNFTENNHWIYKNQDMIKGVNNSNRFLVDIGEAELFHYRGSPSKVGCNIESSQVNHFDDEFDNIDKSMEKYIN